MLKISEVNDIVCAHVTTGPNRGNMGVYVFLTDGLLIDTGASSLLSDLMPFFETADADKVILTHHHEDHTGGAKWIQDNLKLPIFIHENGIDICENDGQYPEYRQVVWGQRKGFQAKPLESIFQSRTSKWEAIFTPGHAFDHVTLLNQNTGMMFSGDLFITPKPRRIFQFESVPIMISSIKKLLKYDFAEMFCSHAGYVRNGKEMFRKRLDYLENMSGEIIELNRKGFTAEEIGEKLLPSKKPVMKVSGGEWDSIHFITSVLNDNGEL